MEVTLKKTKINTSILKQAMRCSVSDFVGGDFIGWCFFNNEQYLVCYQSATNNISKVMLFYRVDKAYQVGSDKRILVTLKFNRYIDVLYEFENTFEAENFYNRVMNAKETALKKGQFFI